MDFLLNNSKIITTLKFATEKKKWEKRKKNESKRINIFYCIQSDKKEKNIYIFDDIEIL